MADKVASKVVGDRFAKVHYPWMEHEPVKLAIREVHAELQRAIEAKDAPAMEEVEAKMCVHASQDGVGTKATGYAKPENGPFCCIGCDHVSEGGTRCDHPEVVEDPDVEKDGKLAVVEPLACCNEYRPKGKDGDKE